MHTACAVAAIFAWHRAGLKILENMRVLHFTHDRNGRSLEPCLFLCIRPDKLDLLFLISHFLDLGAGGRLLFITSLFKWP